MEYFFVIETHHLDNDQIAFLPFESGDYYKIEVDNDVGAKGVVFRCQEDALDLSGEISVSGHPLDFINFIAAEGSNQLKSLNIHDFVFIGIEAIKLLADEIQVTKGQAKSFDIVSESLVIQKLDLVSGLQFDVSRDVKIASLYSTALSGKSYDLYLEESYISNINIIGAELVGLNGSIQGNTIQIDSENIILVSEAKTKAVDIKIAGQKLVNIAGAIKCDTVQIDATIVAFASSAAVQARDIQISGRNLVDLASSIESSAVQISAAHIKLAGEAKINAVDIKIAGQKLVNIAGKIQGNTIQIDSENIILVSEAKTKAVDIKIAGQKLVNIAGKIQGNTVQISAAQIKLEAQAATNDGDIKIAGQQSEINAGATKIAGQQSEHLGMNVLPLFLVSVIFLGRLLNFPHALFFIQTNTLTLVIIVITNR